MESQTDRQERKSMDQCLRRLKQELVCMREAGDGLHAQMNSMMGALQELKLLQVQTALERLEISTKAPSHTHTHTHTQTQTHTHTPLPQPLFAEPPFPDPPTLLEVPAPFCDSSMEEATPPPHQSHPRKKRYSHRSRGSLGSSSLSTSSSSGASSASGSEVSSLLLSQVSCRHSDHDHDDSASCRHSNAFSYEDDNDSASGSGSASSTGSSSGSSSTSSSSSSSSSGLSSGSSWNSQDSERQRQRQHQLTTATAIFPPHSFAPPPVMAPPSLAELQELLLCLSRQGPPLRHDLCPLGAEGEDEDDGAGDWPSSLMSCSRTRTPLVLGDSFLADLVGNWLDLPEVGVSEGQGAGRREADHTPRLSRAQELRRRLALTTSIFKKVLRSVRPDRDKLLKERPGWPDLTEPQNPEQLLLHKRTKKNAAAAAMATGAKPKATFYRPFWSRKGKAGVSLPTDRLPPLGIGPQRGPWVPMERGHPLFDHNAAIWV